MQYISERGVTGDPGSQIRLQNRAGSRHRCWTPGQVGKTPVGGTILRFGFLCCYLTPVLPGASHFTPLWEAPGLTGEGTVWDQGA